MTGYHVSIGYMALGNSGTRMEAWDHLKSIVRHIMDNPWIVKDELLDVESSWGLEQIQEYVDALANPESGIFKVSGSRRRGPTDDDGVN